MNEWIDIADAAERLKVRKRWLYEQTAAGTVPVHRVGRQLRFRPSELDAWVESGQAAAAGA
ncbi:MAG: Excisionase [Frankiales bacterium]|nr:Excisionase [Frankiales bacterium]